MHHDHPCLHCRPASGEAAISDANKDALIAELSKLRGSIQDRLVTSFLNRVEPASAPAAQDAPEENVQQDSDQEPDDWVTFSEELQFTWALPEQDTAQDVVRKREENFGPAQFSDNKNLKLAVTSVLQDFITAANSAIHKFVADSVRGGDTGSHKLSFKDANFKGGAWLRAGVELGASLQDALCFVLGGYLSCEPTLNCLPAAYAFGRRWYVCMPSNNSLQSEIPMPAWSVNKTDESDDSQGSMVMSSFTIPVKFESGAVAMTAQAGRLMASKPKYNVAVKLFALRLDSCSCGGAIDEGGTSTENILLHRPCTEFESDIKTTIADAKKAAADAKKLLGGGQNFVEWNRECKHLRA